MNEIDLHEVSVVTFPAYENTTVQARAKQLEHMQQRKIEEKRKALHLLTVILYNQVL
ncbi:HK97 family phage prohead protease [Bacillus sp. MM2020_4]|uniref:HK97 family phage prohead protease n=1 Tax=Bacillaceae TaxID=186817 RepID=UPI00325A4A6A